MKLFNPNPAGRNVGDCAVRAMCAALDLDWMSAYTLLCLEGAVVFDMPNANAVWGRVLRQHGFVKKSLPDSCLDCYTVGEFARDHPGGTYVLAVSDHVVCVVRDGQIMDSWDSSKEIIIYYFEKAG